MRVILFQDRFAELVRTGTKRQTIRKAARCKPGDTLSLRRWTGKPYRSKQELIREATCYAVEPVEIPLRDDGSHDGDILAAADGFGSKEEMRKWFRDTHGLPFKGEIVKW